MEVVSTHRRNRGGDRVGNHATLSMYHTPPQEEVTLVQFEALAQARMQLLKQVEVLRAKNMQGAELVTATEAAIKKHELQYKQSDNISHFILRLAYCKTEDLRRWFINQEKELFRHRFSQSSDADVDTFLAENNLEFELVDVDKALEARLTQLVGGRNLAAEGYSRCFKVPFQEALDLVSVRRVCLVGGFAYVPRKYLISIVAAKFRNHISSELTHTYRATNGIRQDPRVGQLLATLQYQQGTSALPVTKFAAGVVTLEQLPLLADRSFPLCMQHLYASLKSENHLKHGGRMQFGLFLKGIGLNLNDALTFWRNAFARRTPPDKFAKDYAYTIRHNYGKEGKRTSYTPYGCVKIIHGQPAAGDHHGCPFRHFDQANLAAKLRERKVKGSDITAIMGLVENMHYQVACTKFFEVTHEGYKGENIGNHPNAYFEESANYWMKKEGGTQASRPNGGTVGGSSSSSSSNSSNSSSSNSSNSSSSNSSSSNSSNSNSSNSNSDSSCSTSNVSGDNNHSTHTTNTDSGSASMDENEESYEAPA